MTWRDWENYVPPSIVKGTTNDIRPVKPAKRGKYGAVKTTVDGITFDSKKEAARYQELKALQAAGEIRDLTLQARFPLYVYPFGDHTNPIKVGAYVCDFAYTTKGGVDAIEDVKGMKTPLYRWKKKHVEAQYGITIRET